EITGLAWLELPCGRRHSIAALRRGRMSDNLPLLEPRTFAKGNVRACRADVCPVVGPESHGAESRDAARPLRIHPPRWLLVVDELLRQRAGQRASGRTLHRHIGRQIFAVTLVQWSRRRLCLYKL